MSNDDPNFDFSGNQSSYSGPQGQGNSHGPYNSMPTSPFQDNDTGREQPRGGDVRGESYVLNHRFFEKRASGDEKRPNK